MKHTPKITAILIIFFFLAQINGLLIINQYIDHESSSEQGKIVFDELPYGFERPEVESGISLLVSVAIAIVIGTLLILLLIRFKKPNIWKIWFLFAVILCLSFAFAAFMPALIAFILALGLGLWKIFSPNVIIHNITELFVYGGLAAILVPIDVFTLGIAFSLLILISIYDMYAVWKSKHMVSLAKFTSNANTFAGLFVPYDMKSSMKMPDKEIKPVKRSIKTKNAILGGGDIGFPLLFAGVVFKNLIISNSVLNSFLIVSMIPICVTAALLILLAKAEKGKFYPAMPFLTAGCFAGYLLILLLGLF